MQNKEQFVEDLVAVSAFLVWCPPHSIWGAVRAEDALNAFARIVNIPIDKLQRMITHPQDDSKMEPDQ